MYTLITQPIKIGDAGVTQSDGYDNPNVTAAVTLTAPFGSVLINVVVNVPSDMNLVQTGGFPVITPNSDNSWSISLQGNLGEETYPLADGYTIATLYGIAA